MEFNEKLNEYINNLSCTAKELCELSGLSAATLSRYRSGERVPEMNSDALWQLCCAIAQLSFLKQNCHLTTPSHQFQYTGICSQHQHQPPMPVNQL